AVEGREEAALGEIDALSRADGDAALGRGERERGARAGQLFRLLAGDAERAAERGRVERPAGREESVDAPRGAALRPERGSAGRARVLGARQPAVEEADPERAPVGGERVDVRLGKRGGPRAVEHPAPRRLAAEET